MALSAYRHLLRSIQIAFQGIQAPSPPLLSPSLSLHRHNLTIKAGDNRLLTSALSTARSNFESSRFLSVDSTEASAAIRHAEEVAEVLRRNVVQGKEVEGGQGERFRKLRVSFSWGRREIRLN